MHPIHLPHLLKKPQSTQVLEFEETLADLDTLTPVRGEITLRHGGNFLEVTAQAETIITLRCDRCTQCYNHRLTLDTQELILLQSPSALPSPTELLSDDLSEAIAPDSDFDVNGWLYEQFSLALPLRNLCSNNCQAPPVENPTTDPPMDHRWAALADLKAQLPS